MDFLGAPAFEPYNTSRAIGEGRYKDAILPGISTAAPFLGKPTKLIAEAVRRRRLTGHLLDDSAPKPITEFGPNYELTGPTQDSAKHALDQNTPVATQVPRSPDDEIVFDVPGKNEPWARSSPWMAPLGPLRKEPRDFALDYPHGGITDEAGNLLEDIDGRPLTAKHIAGRRKKGEKDNGLTPDAIQSIIKDDLKIPISRIPRSGLSTRRALGQIGAAPDRTSFAIDVWDRLPKDQAAVVLGHELGHAIDFLAGGIPIKGLKRELRKIYSENYTGRLLPKRLTHPKDNGYKGEESFRRELMAEAIRTAMVNPNTLKTLGPKTAAVLRERLNNHPIISKFLQINGIPLGLVTGAGAMAVSGKEGESHAKQPAPDARTGIRKIARALYSGRTTTPYGGPR